MSQTTVEIAGEDPISVGQLTSEILEGTWFMGRRQLVLGSSEKIYPPALMYKSSRGDVIEIFPSGRFVKPTWGHHDDYVVHDYREVDVRLVTTNRR